MGGVEGYTCPAYRLLQAPRIVFSRSEEDITMTEETTQGTVQGTARYDFDQMADRGLDHARKWDAQIIQQKFPGTPKDFIPMWIADMDFPAAPAVRQALTRIAENGAYGYTYAHDGFYDAVINWQKRRHNNEVKREWITLSYGCVSTMHYMYQAFCQPDDCVILNTPVYDPFGYAAHHNGIRVISNPLIYRDRTYYIDYDLLDRQMAENHPRVILFCSPHNPAGRIWTADEIERVAELCLKHNVILAVDEVHSEHILEGSFSSALQLPERYLDNLIVLTSPNKGFNLGGLKTSYSMIPSDSLRNRFRHRLNMNSITSPNVFGCAAIIAAYNECEDWLDAVTAYLAESYREVETFIEERMEGWELMHMQASYLPWVNVAGTGCNATEITKHMAKEAGVIIEDGSHYVSDGDDFVRLNLGMPRKLVMECMERMASHQLARR